MITTSCRRLRFASAALSTLLLGAPDTASAASPEVLVGFRGPAPYPDGGGRYLWFPTTREATVWQNGLDNDQIVDFGWNGIQQFFLADLDGDGADDKVMYQLQAGDVAQVITTYTGTNPLSFTTADFNAPNGDLDIPYAWIPQGDNSLAFGDIDKDGIDDCCIIIAGDTLDTGGSPVVAEADATALYWGCWFTDGNAGISDPGSGPFSQWNPFGVVGLDEPFLGDFNGDGVDDRLLYRADPAGDGSQPPQVFINYSDPNGNWGNGAADVSLTLGLNGDKLQVSDINGDDLDDLVLYARPSSADPTNLQTLFGFYNDGAGFASLNGASPDITADWGIGDGVLFAQLNPETGGGEAFRVVNFTRRPDGGVDLRFDTIESDTYEIWATPDLDFFGNEAALVDQVTGGPGFLDITVSGATLDSLFTANRPILFFRAEQ